MNIYKTKKII